MNMYEVSRTLLWFEILVVSFPISSTYGRFTWVISINANGDYNVNPPCLNGKTRFGFPSGACVLSLGTCYIATGKMYRYLLIQFVQVFTCNSPWGRVFVKKETKATSPVSYCSPSDTISRCPLEYWILIKREDGPFPKELISLKQLRKHWRKHILTMYLSFINKTLLISWDSISGVPACLTKRYGVMLMLLNYK